jgi:N-formylmaleamate deformylase
LSDRTGRRRPPPIPPSEPGRGGPGVHSPAWPSGDIRANGIRLHYYRIGGPKPPVVLAHGFSDNALCWTSIARALEETHDVVMVDARGHGRSEAPPDGYGPLNHADDLAGVIAGLGLRRPIVLGHSMGAVSVLVLAGRHPELVRAAVLEDPPAWWMQDSKPFDPKWLAETKAWIAEVQTHNLEEIVARERTEEPGWNEEELVPWADSKLQLSLNVFSQSGRIGVDWPKLLGKIACPVLLITADPERGAIVTETQAADLRARVPHVSIAHIRDASHSIHRDQPAQFLQAVQAFFNELPDSGE